MLDLFYYTWYNVIERLRKTFTPKEKELILMELGQVRDVLDFNFSEYENLDEWINGDDMFWGDLTLHIDDTSYIYDAYNGLWYSIETKYHYADIGYLLENNYKVDFWIVDDEDIHKELDELFNQ